MYISIAIFKEVQGETKNDDSRTDELNFLFSSNFVSYILNNWCWLIPLWTSHHLGDQGRQGTSDPYQAWSMHFKERTCIKDPPRTQGIIEFHNKSVKHITLNSKRDRVDKIIDNLFVAKNSKGKQ